MHRRLVATAALALLAASCRDEDIADDPVLPANVDATVEECGIVEGAPLALVDVTNGTGHTARFEVTVAFVREGRVESSAVVTSEDVPPGRASALRFRGEGDAVDDCRVEDVTDLSG